MRRLVIGAIVLCAVLGLQHSTSVPTPIQADGQTRVTSYFCPPNCGNARWTGNRPVAGWTAACAYVHRYQYAHLVSVGIEVFCEDWGAYGYFESGYEPVDVFGIYLGQDYDFVWYSDDP